MGVSVVSCADAPPALEPGEEVLDLVALAIECLVVSEGDFPASARWNAGFDAFNDQRLAERGAIIAAVGDEGLGWRQGCGHEACALFCRAPDGALAARVFTIGSHTACPIVVSCPEGYTATAENIHSHGERGEFQVNAADKVLLPRARTGQRVRRGNPEAFSDEDQEGGATYLVSPLAVQHFDGKRVRRL